jgi:hypothetical protein
MSAAAGGSSVSRINAGSIVSSVVERTAAHAITSSDLGENVNENEEH